MAAGDNNSVLRAENLGRVIAGKTLLDGIRFEVSAGETLAVVGPSGSGKSSLLRLLNRLDEPTTGTVYVEGVDYRELDPRHLRTKVGLVTQRPFLFPGTVATNLQFGPQQRGEELNEGQISQLLEEVGLIGFAERDTAKLSGGEAQRVSLARTLANSPSVLLLDEPTSALDEASKIEVEACLRRIVVERHHTCILVTHENLQALRLAQRALVLDHGRIVKTGPVGETLHA
jgi:putative ABC transport system ATP-binding protein